MDRVREEGLSFADAAACGTGRSGRPFDPVRAFMVETWLEQVEARFAKLGIEGHLP
jgi:hypothetical protein